MDRTIQKIIERYGEECELCGQNMLRSDGCTYAYVEYKGNPVERIKYGEESGKGPCERCPICDVLPGHFHHKGCFVEECPICGDLITSCGCNLSYTEIEEE